MSEPELLAYMTGTNDDFDLPRWHTQLPHDALSSSAQAAQSAAQASSYLFTQGQNQLPPPQSAASGNRLPPIQQSPNSSRQPRVNQLLDEDQSYSLNSLPYLSPGNAHLSRSTSLGGAAAATSGSRARRHHMQDDLEGAFSVDNVNSQRHTPTGLPQHPQNSLYPSSVAYHQGAPSLAGGTGSSASAANSASPGDPYQDAYFPGTAGHLPKRSQTQHDPSTSTRNARSPLRGANPSHPILDPYSPQQNQYNASNTAPPPPAAYPYSPSSDHRQFSTQNYPAQHARSQSHVKSERGTPPIPPPAYSPQGGVQSSSGVYSPPYPMETTSPAPSSSQNPPGQRPISGRPSISQPSTPLSYHPSQSPAGGTQYFNKDHQPMSVDFAPPKRRASGLRRVRDQRDLRPFVNQQPPGRRMDADGTFLSPVRQLTTNIVQTYHICNPQFRYESTHNPRRVLTKPSKPAHNEGFDNEDYDYILYVNDWLGTDEGHKYLILDILGQGTFGQVVKCQNMKTHEVVAVKVVKNKPAYFNQSMMEVTILELLNNQCDPHDEHHILRLRDSFIHKNHLCLVFELLSSNLYELIKQNQFQGLSTQLVKVFTAQLLDSMTILKEARLIHCDLKPENILLKSLQSPQIKVIDFGSACHERQTVYTYIQSRFYRSPEVLLGIPYTAAIDMWSLGCIAVELFLGLPLFPGTSEYNQITRIVEMLGLPPQQMLDVGKQTAQFFDSYTDIYGQKTYKLKSLEQYSREHNTQEQPGKQYFKANSLPEIIQGAPMPTFKSTSRQTHEAEKEMNNRAAFIDFCQGLLNMNPRERWTPQQARQHPFITGEKWSKPWTPANSQQTPPPVPTSTGTDPKRPYGGLIASQPKSGSRAYHDAAAYNQHLAQQQQAYTQAQVASQAAQNVYRNPYITPPSQQPPQQAPPQSQPSQTNSSASFGSSRDAVSSSAAGYGQNPQIRMAQQAVASQGHLGANTNASSQYAASHGSGFPVPQHMSPTAPSNTYQAAGTTRNRSNTINNMMDNVPPALARLQHMNQDVIGGRKALTPVLKRDDAIREWERRQSGKAAAAQPYPQLEYLQQQAELAAQQGNIGNWGYSSSASNRYPAPPTSNLAHSSYTNAHMVVDDDRRNAVMSDVRNAARADPNTNLYGASSNVIPSPPQAYTSNSTTAGNRYAATYNQQQPANPGASFDPLDGRQPVGPLYQPMQPDQFAPYNGNASTQSNASGRGQVAPPAQAVPPSFYGAGVVPSGPSASAQPQRNPFTGTEGLPTQMPSLSTKESRRKSGMDLWTQ
ncbi:dual specificity protein kinase yak1 [Steccherinum ochraceum]|uniref:Dual specificity protein kinase yak1 n=1 Tax=Steccherinum ochraceum TaxID=92696 RepID=A0A4R0RM53_9APHY|nr:dual specificity protein kinase yak1 [Steccherinum ochraceum]